MSLQYIWDTLGSEDNILRVDDFFITEPGTKPVLPSELDRIVKKGIYLNLLLKSTSNINKLHLFISLEGHSK